MAADRSRVTAPPVVGFKASFNCLWCGRPHQTRTDQDLEGWAILCPECVGNAQDNEFLRFRLREGLRRRSAAAEPKPEAAPVPMPTPAADATDDQMRAYYAARAP